MKKLFLATLILVFSSCSGSSSGDKTSTVEGMDYSGTYAINGVTCYNSSLTAITTSASYASSNSTTIISGNNLTDTTTDGACTVVVSFNIKFVDSSTVNLTNRRVVSATGGACTINTSLSSSPAHTITPSSDSTTYTTGQTYPDVVGGYYVRNPSNGAIGVFSTHTNSASSTDKCFIVLAKY